MSNPFKEIVSSASMAIKQQNEKMKVKVNVLKEKMKARKNKFLRFLHPVHEEEKKEVEEGRRHSKSVVETGSKDFEPESNEKNKDDDLLLCPISQEIMTDPVMTPYGHCFQRQYIEEWLLKHDVCPITGKPLNVTQLMPCYTVKAIVEEHLKAQHK